MLVDRVITGGRIVKSNSVIDADIAINNGCIAAVGSSETMPEAKTTVDATGLLVMPGMIDPHVHLDSAPPPRNGKYETETAAAALGGVTTLLDFAWQGGPSRSDSSMSLTDGIDFKRKKESEAYVDFGLHGTISNENIGVFKEIEKAIEMGVTSFKMFMSTYDFGVSNGFINLVIDELSEHGVVAMLHTEDPSVCEHQIKKLKRERKSDPIWYPDSRPDYAEAIAADDALRMATEAGAKYYGVHTTSKKAAEVIERYREDGSQVRAETCTHYTVCDRSAFEKMGNLPVIAPPIRTEKDNEAMFNFLQNGTIDTVGTDHVSYPKESKVNCPWWESQFGVNSVQVSLPIFHDEAVVNRGFSYPFLVEKMSTNVAQTFGLPQKGSLDPGTDADIVLFDPKKSWQIDVENNASNSDYSIYKDKEVTGYVEQTYVRGELVVKDGNIVSEPGIGSYIPRKVPDWSS